jgi:signal peptidase II
MRWTHILIALGVFVLDQLTKAAIAASIPLQDFYTVIPGFFRLTHVQNTGAAFGIFAESASQLKTGALIGLSAVSLVVVVMLLWRQNLVSKRTGIGLALILGGASGNLFDRMLHGSVVDFLMFYYQSYQWPSFNVADSAIVIGAGLLVLDMFRTKPVPRKVASNE